MGLVIGLSFLFVPKRALASLDGDNNVAFFYHVI